MRSLKEKLSEAQRRLLALMPEDELERDRIMSQLEDGRQAARSLALELELLAVQRELAEVLELARELERQASRFESALEEAGVATYQAAPDGKLTSAGEALARMLGYGSPQELIASAPEIGQKLRRAGQSELQLRRKDDRPIWVMANSRAIRDGQGQVLYYEGTVRDITEQKSASLALDALIVWRWDLNASRFTFVSKGAERLLGYPAEDWLREPNFLADRAHPDDRGRAASLFARAAEVHAQAFEHRMIAADGRTVRLWCMVRATQEAPRELIGLMVDITDIEVAREPRLAEHMAIMNHEMRTPMNGIMGMAELLLGAELTEEQREYAVAIRDSARALLALMDDMADLWDIEAGKLALRPSEFRLRRLLLGAIRGLSGGAREKGLELICDVPTDVPDALIGDAARLRQMLINLIGEAMNSAERGQIELKVRRSQSEASEDSCLLEFSISGARAQHDLVASAPGGEIRLAISKRLAELMGGQMWIEGGPGRGSALHFTARFGLGPGNHLRALIVEDDPAQCRALAEALSRLGIEPQTDRSAGGPFALAIVDVDSLAGREKAKLSRRLAGAAIIALGSAVRSEAEANLHGLKVAARLAKPFERSDLEGAILRALEGDDPNRPETGRPLRILLVEDSLVNQRIAARLLEKRGHSVSVAGSGERALELLSAERFDLVLMDVQMPGMDGLEAASRIRRLEGASAHTPIIAMTACALEKDREACLRAGMDAYISKPIQWGELFELMDRVIRQSDAEVLDWDAAASLLGGDQELLKDAAGIFLEDAPGLLLKVKEAIARRDARALERAAHMLKGQASTFAARRASEAALKLEMMGRRDDLAQAEEAFAELERELGRLSCALAERIKS